MSSSAKEAGEQVERVLLLTPTSLLVLLYSFMAILVVDFARFRLDKCLIGFSDFNEFLVGRVIAAAEQGELA